MTDQGELSRRRSELSPAERALAERRKWDESRTPAPEEVFSRRAKEDCAHLSYAQERLWFLDQFEPGNPIYNVPIAYRVTGQLSVRALEQSLGEIVRRPLQLRSPTS